jgi:hypothetical protein
MFSFDIRTDIGDLRQRLTDIERLEVPWATKLALDDTAKAVIVAEEGEMRTVFDRPTAWTLGGLRWSAADGTARRPRSISRNGQSRDLQPAFTYNRRSLAAATRPHSKVG